MAVEIVGGQRLLDPGEIEVGEAPGAPDRFVEREALIGVGHDLIVWPERRTHRRQPAIVLRGVRAPDLDLRALKSLFARRDRVLDQRAFIDMQPAAFGGVERAAIGGAAGDDPERQLAPPASEIPKRGVDRGQREGGNRADRRRVGGVFQFPPDRLDPLGVLADEPRREMVGDEAHHRRAAGPDRVAVARPGGAVAVGNRHDRRLLRDEALDGVGALDLGRDVDQPQFDALDQRHFTLPSPQSNVRRRSRRDAPWRGRRRRRSSCPVRAGSD